MKVHWYCGMYVGPSKWRETTFDWVNEPDECAGELVTEESPDEWADGICAVYCPSCNAHLTQGDGHGEMETS